MKTIMAEMTPETMGIQPPLLVESLKFVVVALEAGRKNEKRVNWRNRPPSYSLGSISTYCTSIEDCQTSHKKYIGRVHSLHSVTELGSLSIIRHQWVLTNVV